MLPLDDRPAPPPVPGGAELAPLSRRAGGLLLDQLLLTVPVAVVLLAQQWDVTVEDAVVPVWVTPVLLGTTVLYQTLCVWWWGRTLGKLVAGTRVIALDGARPTATGALQRALVPSVVTALPVVGSFLLPLVYVIALGDPLRRGLHDRAAGTLVVRAR